MLNHLLLFWANGKEREVGGEAEIGRGRGQPGAGSKDQPQLEGNSCGPDLKSTVSNPDDKHLKDRD